jgi:hypothetical protein
VVVSYNIRPFAGEGIASLDVVDVLGISIPFVLLFISSMALGWAIEPSVLIAKLCEKTAAGNSSTMYKIQISEIIIGFIMKVFTQISCFH